MHEKNNKKILHISKILYFLLFIFNISICYAQLTPKISLLLLEVTVNQQTLSPILEFYEDINGELWVSQHDLSLLHLPPLQKKPAIFFGKKYYALSWYKTVRYSLNRNTLSLSISVPTQYFPQITIDAMKYDSDIIRPQYLGLFLNYDLTSIRNAAADITSNSGLFELGLSNQFGVGTNNLFIGNYNAINASNARYHFIRLDTTWTLDQPEKAATWRFGDSITGSSSWSNSARFGGIQYATNFNTQPNFITFPLPGFKGNAIVPTNVQIFVNGILNQKQNIDNGSYVFNNIPVVTGAGTLSVMTQDLLGRSQTINLPYYASPLLLKPGLTNYSYETGFVRQQYGLTSNDYHQFFTTATYQQGITDTLTLGTHIELLAKQQTAGVSSDYLVNQLGIISLATAISTGQFESGWLGSAGMIRQTPLLNIGFKSTYMSSNYQQIGIQNGQPGTIGASSTNQFFLGYDFKSLGSVGLSYTTIKQFAVPDAVSDPGPQLAKIGTASYSYNFSNNISFTVSIINDFTQSSNNQIVAGLTIPLDSQHTANTYVSRQNADVQPAVLYSRNLPLGNGYGYHILATNDGNSNGPSADFTYQNEYGAYTGKAYRIAHQNYYEADISGATLYLDQQVFLSREMTQSYALVQVPHYPNVRVYYQNQLVGRTNHDGNLLVPGILPYQNNQIAIEPLDLPLTATHGNLDIQVKPYYRSGSIAKFTIQESTTLLLRLLKKNGDVVPVGATVTLDKNKSTLVGYEGMLFLSSIRPGIINGTVDWAKKSCHFQLIIHKNTLNNLRAIDVLCL